MRAHELAAALDPESEDYRRVMAAVKFDLGDVDRAQALANASTRTFFEIPAPICLFQVIAPWGPELYLAWEDDGGVSWKLFMLAPFGIAPIEAWVHDGMSVRRIHGGPTITGPDCMTEADKICASSYRAMACAVEVFSCCNVAQIEHQPPKFINAKRISKGKVPFFTYRTLHITSDAAPANGQTATGTHASPRLHLRRGHIRRLADDRRIWVRASLVGDKSKGFAAKDYSVQL